VESAVTHPSIRELRVLASIDAALALSHHVERSYLLRAMREAHQEAYGQLRALERLGVLPPSDGDLGTAEAMTIERLAALERTWAASHAGLREGTHGVAHAAFSALAERGFQRAHVLDDHLGRRSHAMEARVCMRCLLDRSGRSAALERRAPHTYVCAACHDEVVAEHPALRHHDHLVIEKALARSSRQSARDLVHTVLAGQAPRAQPVLAPAAVTARAASTPVVVPSRLSIHAYDATDQERRYFAVLFDPRRMRDHW
jgi:hypothetical protein